MAVSTALGFLGVALEVAPGTGVAASNYIPILGRTPFDNLRYLDDQGYRGAMVETYDEVLGVRHSEFDFNGDVYADSIGWPLAGVLGDVATTGGGAPYSHTMAVYNGTDGQPASYSITDHYGLTGGTPARRYVGMKFSELALKWQADQMFTYAAKAQGFVSGTVAKPTQSFGAVTAEPSWEIAVSIGGSSVAYCESGELVIARPIAPLFGVGSQDPYKMWGGRVKVTGKLTHWVDTDDTEYIRYLTNTKPALVLDATHGASAALVEVKFTMTKCAYKVAKPNYGKDAVQLDVDFEAIANTTDVGASSGYSPIKALIKNALVSGTYHS